MLEFPAVVPGEPCTVSASAYVTYRQCPDRSAARFQGIYGPPSVAQLRGKLAHRIFARHLGGDAIDGDRLEQVCREEIGAGKGMNMTLGELRLRPSQLQGVIREVGELYERFKATSRDGFRRAEVDLEVLAGFDVTLRGTIDAVYETDGGVKLVDWKTGGVGDDAEHQLAFYALVWGLQHGELPGHVEAVSVKTGERRTAVPTLSEAAATAAAVAEMVTELRRSWDQGTGLRREAGPWCRWCPVLTGCAEGQAAVDPARARQPVS